MACRQFNIFIRLAPSGRFGDLLVARLPGISSLANIDLPLRGGIQNAAERHAALARRNAPGINAIKNNPAPRSGNTKLAGRNAPGIDAIIK